MDPLLLTVVLLAALQGVTEFLPVSSSGHLVVAAALLAPGGDPRELEIVDLSIVLHAGTLGSILVFYGAKLGRLLGEDRRVVLLLAVGTLPAAAVGVPLKLFAADLLQSPLVAGLGLVATGLMLALAPRLEPGERDYPELGVFEAFLVGLAQAAAILPGVSRSGSTITAGLGLNLSPQAAATFSFLLAVPAIGGASVLEIKDLLKEHHPQSAVVAAGQESGGTRGEPTAPPPKLPLAYLALGAAISFAVGLVALWVLTHLLESGRFVWFAAWCIPLGIGVIAWTILRAA